MTTRARAARGPVAGVLAIAVFAGLWAMLASSWLFPYLSANGDEGLYLLQAETLRGGELAPPAPVGEEDAFVPWFSSIDDERELYILKYTPVHAALLVVGDIVHSTRFSLGLLAAAQVLAVALLAHEVHPRRSTVLVSAALFATAPLSVMLSGTYLPYGTSLMVGLGATACALRATRVESSAWMAAGGLLTGLGLFARPYDAVLWMVIAVLGIAALGRLRSSVRLLPAAVVGAAGPVVLLLVYNSWATGDALQLPFNLLEPDDKLGFGPRRALPGDPYFTYDVSAAGRSLVRNGFLVLTWTGGGLIAVAAAIYALARKLGRHGAVLIAIMVVWPLGYFFFWGSYVAAHLWDGALILGPYYYLPVTAAVAIAAPVGLREARRRFGHWIPASAAVMILLNGVVLLPAFANQRERSTQRRAVAEALDTGVQEPAVVFISSPFGEYLQNPFSFLRNQPDLDGDRVYVLDRGQQANQRIQALYADRQAYLLEVQNGWSDKPGFVPNIRLVEVADTVG